jgi:hypothetical protein
MTMYPLVQRLGVRLSTRSLLQFIVVMSKHNMRGCWIVPRCIYSFIPHMKSQTAQIISDFIPIAKTFNIMLNMPSYNVISIIQKNNDTRYIYPNKAIFKKIFNSQHMFRNKEFNKKLLMRAIRAMPSKFKFSSLYTYCSSRGTIGGYSHCRICDNAHTQGNYRYDRSCVWCKRNISNTMKRLILTGRNPKSHTFTIWNRSTQRLLRNDFVGGSIYKDSTYSLDHLRMLYFHWTGQVSNISWDIEDLIHYIIKAE